MTSEERDAEDARVDAIMSRQFGVPLPDHPPAATVQPSEPGALPNVPHGARQPVETEDHHLTGVIERLFPSAGD